MRGTLYGKRFTVLLFASADTRRVYYRSHMETQEHRIGIFPTLTNDEHHASPAVGSSGLKLLERSPLHYWTRYRAPDREPNEPTPAMKLGTAWHTAVFEPARFAEEYIEIPEGLDKRTKEGKALWADIEASGRQPITAADLARLESMAEAARSHPAAQVIFDQAGMAEASMFWVDASTGLHCKIRPDFAVEPCAMFRNGLVVDGKTCEDASPPEFGRQAWNLEYGLQAAWYVDGYQQVFGTRRPPGFVWLVQEKDAPFATAVYSAGDDLLEFGRRRYRKLLDVLARCESSGLWPGYPIHVAPLELPAWAAKQVQEVVA
jgi:exodeoxyribonuclease VIII